MLKLLTFLLIMSCGNKSSNDVVVPEDKIILPGANQFDQYGEILKNKRVGLVANQTSVVKNIHLLDHLIRKGIDVKKIFTPEHGFRGKADAGEKVSSNLDAKTGLPIVSLYGKNKKPSKDNLQDLDCMVFDLQDVGVRFYTYISTLHYVMEACAENNIPLIILDRPNPNGHYIDGPMLEENFSSFIGLHPVPVVYGMTIGEYGLMINGQNWLKNGVKTNLTVIPCENYTHNRLYELPIKPSPNLPNIRSILLYPSLCFFEGTHVSVGRGTNKQFQQIGAPQLSAGKTFRFKPVSMEGAKYPKHENQFCYGDDLSGINVEALHSKLKELDLKFVIEYFQYFDSNNQAFFLENNFFDKLAGTDKLRQQIIQGLTEDQIRATWQDDLAKFKEIRVKYLLYE